jgi:glycosyltransferase involved in cell wall biosynthesis
MESRVTIGICVRNCENYVGETIQSILKILEYFSCGLPVVSTSIGAEGLCGEDGVNILIEDNLERFALRIVELLEDTNLANVWAAPRGSLRQPPVIGIESH